MLVDTGAWIARYNERDEHHAVAGWAWNHLPDDELRTSSLVVAELINRLSRQRGPREAGERARRIYASTQIEILRPDASDELAALDLMDRYADARIGFVDSVSFVLMRRHGIQRAFTFDHHFAIAGFEPWPATAARG